MINRVTLSNVEALRQIDSAVYADGDILMASMEKLMLGHLTVALFRMQSGWAVSGETDDGILFIKSSIEPDRYWERVVKGVPTIYSSGPQSLGPLSSYTFTHPSDPDRRRMTRFKMVTVNQQVFGDINFSPTEENVEFLEANPHMYPFDWSNETVRLNGGMISTREGSNIYPSGYEGSEISWHVGMLESNGDVNFIGSNSSDNKELIMHCPSNGSEITGATVKDGEVGYWHYIKSIYDGAGATINTSSVYPVIWPISIGPSSFSYDGDPLGGYKDFVTRAVCCLPDGSMIGTRGTLSDWQWEVYEPNDDNFYLFEPSGSSWNETYLSYIGGTAARTSGILDGWPFAPYSGRFVVSSVDYGGSYYNQIVACWVISADGSTLNLGGSGGYYEQSNGASIYTAANPLNGIVIAYGIFFDENKYHYKIASFTTNVDGIAGGVQWPLEDFAEAWNIKTQDLTPANTTSMFPTSNAMLDGYFSRVGIVYKIENATYPKTIATIGESNDIAVTPALDASAGYVVGVAINATKFAALYHYDSGWQLYTYSFQEDTNFKSTAVLLPNVLADAISIVSITPNTIEPAGTSIRYLVENSAGSSFYWNGSTLHWESMTDITTGNTTAEFTAADHSLLIAEVGSDISIKVALITDGTDTPELLSFGTDYSRGEDFFMSDDYMDTYADSDTETRLYNRNTTETYIVELDVFIFP